MSDIIVLNPCYENSTFEGAEIDVYNIDTDGEVALDLTGSTIVMNMVKDGDIYKTYSTANGTLTIDTNKIIIPSSIVDLKEGVYTFDFDVTLLNGVRLTGFAAGTWTILKAITV